MARTVETDVLIIGAGIAGSALACALRNSSLRVTILERSALPLDTARGDHLQPRSCEILKSWGVLDDFFKAGAEKRGDTTWRNQNDEIFFASNYDELNTSEPYFAFLNHELIGDILLDSASGSDNTQLIKPCQQWSIVEKNTDSVAVKAIDADGEEWHIKSKILVGADGRSSKVRENHDFETQIIKYQKPLIVLFGTSPAYQHARDLNIYLRQDRMVTLIPRTGGGFKIAIPEQRSEVKAWKKASEDQLKQGVAQYLPELELESVHFCDFYQPIDLRTSNWVEKNVVLIGDSCHAMHPARSLGMNLTIQNVNELANVLSNSPPEQYQQILLEYQQHNKPALDKILDENHRYAEFMDSNDSKTFAVLEQRLSALKNNKDAMQQRLMTTAGYR